MSGKTANGKVRRENRSMLDPELLEILACPETKEAVRLGDAALLKRVNDRIARGEQKNRAGEPVREPIEAILVRADAKVGYAVRDGIPIMLVDEALPL
jgi:uncharacterized protein YbaR (Trm112 family)